MMTGTVSEHDGALRRRRILIRSPDPASTEGSVSIPQWNVTGDWFDTCKCSIPCPCYFAQPPTTGDCEGVLAWHVRVGKYGDVGLDGLNVIALGSFVGNIWA